MRVALLAGGTGGAKLAAGMQELIGPDLAVIANTGDDTRIHGLYVSPDPDLITYWLAGEIDEERGWGIRGDTFVVHERLEHLGSPGWFQLSDRDLATCLYRTHFMAEETVTTRVLTPGGWRELQEFLIIDGSEPAIEAVEVQGIGDARPTPEVSQALEAADAVVIGPSNPVISIGPIVAVPGMREAIAASGAPVLAVSPFVAGRAIKGPTEKFMEAVRRPSTAAGVASLYEGMVTAMVVDADDPDPGPEEIQLLSCPTLMEGAEGRRELAERVLEFAEVLG